jgi:hypothetical protein
MNTGSIYSSIADSPQFSAVLSRYNSYAQILGLTKTASANEIRIILETKTTFAQVGNFRAGLFVLNNGCYIQGTPFGTYGVRSARHEILHLGAALRGQADTALHKIGVQLSATPENLFGLGALVSGVFYGSYYISTR